MRAPTPSSEWPRHLLALVLLVAAGCAGEELGGARDRADVDVDVELGADVDDTSSEVLALPRCLGSNPGQCFRCSCTGPIGDQTCEWVYIWPPRSLSCSWQVNVQVSKWGTGSGEVSSSPGGIYCDAPCWNQTASFWAGTTVQLTATPSPGSVFARWEGACQGSGPTCTLRELASDTFVRPVFEALVPLTVEKYGAGTVVDSSFGLINCGDTCTMSYWMYTPVVLVATPEPGATLLGWAGGGCSGTSLTCTVTVDEAKTVLAVFSSN